MKRNTRQNKKGMFISLLLIILGMLSIADENESIESTSKTIGDNIPYTLIDSTNNS